MNRAGVGLTEVHSDDLKTLLAALHRGQLDAPLGVVDLTRIGLQHCATLLLEQLRTLDGRAVQTVLVMVLAERRAHAEALERARRMPHGGEA